LIELRKCIAAVKAGFFARFIVTAEAVTFCSWRLIEDFRAKGWKLRV